MDERRLRVELSSAWTANQLLNELVAKLRTEIRTLQKAREREKYTLRQKQKNATRLDTLIRELRDEALELLRENRGLRKANLSFAPRQIKLSAENKRLTERELWLDALEAAGVDNWEGYDEALEILRKNQNET